MMSGMREIEYFSIGKKKRLVYQIRVEEVDLQIYMTWNTDTLPGHQTQMQGFSDINRLEERLAEMNDRLIAHGYTQVPFGYTEQMDQFETDIEDMRRAESGVR